MWTTSLRLGAVFGAAFSAGVAAGVIACSTSTSGGFDGPNGGGGAGADGASAGCQLCVTNADCNGGKCVQLAGDSFCEETCGAGGTCTPDDTCATETTVEGEQVSVCVPKSDLCGAPVGPPAEAGGCTASAPADMCGSLAGPSIASKCSGCGASSTTCQANGCYGGWYCNTATNKCQAPPSPSMCPPPTSTCDAGNGSIVVDAGGPVTGAVGANGGTVSRLFFGVVGDTRPPIIDDTKGYPSAVAAQIWTDLQNVSPRPLFALSTGDYMFASANGTQAGPQMDLYLAARAHYTNTVFPAMGNHECTGAVTSNCGPGTTDGTTNNYSVFMSKLLAPLGKASPNYSVEIDAEDRSWTSKHVFIAGNSWTSSDATWLTGVMAQKTTYTFVIRHEPKAAASPGTAPSEAIMAQYPYTLAIVGHTHTYGKTGPKQVTIGNGGAPLVGAVNYGYGLVQQRADGTIQVDMIDSSTGKADTAFRFALHPDGTPAP